MQYAKRLSQRLSDPHTVVTAAPINNNQFMSLLAKQLQAGELLTPALRDELQQRFAAGLVS